MVRFLLSGFLVAALWLLPAGGGAAEESLTVSRLDLPFWEAYQPACVSLPEDGSLMAFQSPHPDGYGQHDIWMSRFEKGRWSEPFNPGPGINTVAQEYDGKLSADGRTLVFIRSDRGVPPGIYMSHLVAGEWSEAQPLGPPVSLPDSSELGAVLTRDGSRLYFSSNRPGGYGGYDVYYSDSLGDGWGEPVNLGPNINSAADEVDAAIGRDGKTLILHLQRDDSTEGSVDFYVSRLVDGEWTPLRNMGPRFNTPGKDACAWLGYDGHTLYMNSTWEGLVSGREREDSRWGWVYRFRYSPGF